MNTKINIYPVLVKSKASKKTGECPLHLSVDLNNKKVSFPSLKRKLLPIHWDEEKKQVKSSHPFHAVINALINKRKLELQAEFDRLEVLDVKINKDRAKKLSKGIKAGQDYHKFCLEQIEARDYEPSTKRAHTAEVTKLQKYAPTLSFNDITYQFLQGYETYMRDTLKNVKNTVWKTFKFHNTMLIAAVKMGGYIKSNPFDEYERAKYSQGIPDFLEWDEFTALKKYMAKDKTLAPLQHEVGYRFLLSCVAGFRFGDAARYTYDSFVVKDTNGERLILYAQKNKEIISIAFTKDIRDITQNLHELPPMTLSNQEFNRELKVLGKLAGIKKNLHSHMGRHTFGMHCAELGMSVDDTQKLLGHRDRNSTLIYFRIKNSRLDNAMQVWDKAKK